MVEIGILDFFSFDYEVLTLLQAPEKSLLFLVNVTTKLKIVNFNKLLSNFAFIYSLTTEDLKQSKVF